MQGGTLIAEGGYGCIFRPAITCQGKATNDTKYVSKIQKDNFAAKNEVKIGKLLKKVLKNKRGNPLLNNFAPVLSTCALHTQGHQLGELKDCKILKKNPTSAFSLMRIRYIEGTGIDHFLLEQANSPLIWLTFVSSYDHLLRSGRMLGELGIIHNDLKSQNIIYAKDVSLPIVIDFGLSIPISDLQKSNIEDYFYTYAPEYYIWPLEVHLLNYTLYVGVIDQDGLLSIVDQYVAGNAALRSFSLEWKRRFHIICQNILQGYIGLDKDAVVSRVLKHWCTWDNYSLSIMFLKTISTLSFGPKKLVSPNEFLKSLTELLLLNIHPDPTRRLSPTATIKRFEGILYGKTVDKITVFEQLIDRVAKHKDFINDSIREGSRQARALARKIRRRGAN